HQAAKDSNKTVEEKDSGRLVKEFKDDEKVTFLVKFSEKADVTKVAENAKSDAAKASLSAQKAEHVQRSAVISELKTTALESQENVKAFLEEQESKGKV
ncbi:hypothetical protein, partial [Virgibacillus salexigens]|uniref:hypothetical protein n=1 Tax=Virgibacillus salexigens TaxID=61016 RepID=UPI00190A541A